MSFNYSVQSILQKSESEQILDLSTNKKRLLLLNSKNRPVSNDPDKSIEAHDCNKPDPMFMNNIFMPKSNTNISNANKIGFSGIDRLFINRCGSDHRQSLMKTNFPWQLIKTTDTTAAIINQFQNFLTKKSLDSNSFFNRPTNPNTNLNLNNSNNNNNFKSVFPHNSDLPNPFYFPNINQMITSGLNPTNSSELVPNLPAIVNDTFISKTLSNPALDINAQFNLHSILKSTSNRKRKRTKVTDTRLPRRNTVQSFDGYSQIPSDQSVQEIRRFSNYMNPPSSSPQSNHSDDISGDPKKYTLTPIHLRKAKLMFLYTRYPNSQMLKSYFPDITFYKQNTAQLVKWFSNFREFYYSEMEKAVQRAISNGVKYAKDLDVTVDSELFKNLMTHFNKKKQIVVPCEFLTTVQITLREFFEAISSGKNLHQSWKKPIYKNIAKLDQPLPEFFKDMNWMMELAKDENENLSS